MSERELANALVLQDATSAVSYLMPTETGLKKSIMDAIAPFREFLTDQGIHDFSLQGQGQPSAVRFPARFVTDQDVVGTTVSLYRPNTKQGDPRIWFTSLPEHAGPGDLLAIVAFEGRLWVLNVSRSTLARDLDNGVSTAEVRFVEAVRAGEATDALDLLRLMRQIASRGPVPAVGHGDTAVGRTLEALLGVPINSAKAPDWRGIELKSFRSERENRKTLFAQVPDWTRSPLKSSAAILDHFGYSRGDVFKLYVTLSSATWNSRGLRLALRAQTDELYEVSQNPAVPVVAVWALSHLRARLRRKHRETFWVEAQSLTLNDMEHFIFRRVTHTREPVIAQLEPLLANGRVTMDHLIKRTNGRVVEKGPLFKIDSHGYTVLFPETRTYQLVQ